MFILFLRPHIIDNNSWHRVHVSDGKTVFFPGEWKKPAQKPIFPGRFFPVLPWFFPPLGTLDYASIESKSWVQQ